MGHLETATCRRYAGDTWVIAVASKDTTPPLPAAMQHQVEAVGGVVKTIKP